MDYGSTKRRPPGACCLSCGGERIPSAVLSVDAPGGWRWLCVRCQRANIEQLLDENPGRGLPGQLPLKGVTK